MDRLVLSPQGVNKERWAEVLPRVDRAGVVEVSRELLEKAESSGEIFALTMEVGSGVPLKMVGKPCVHLLSCGGGLRESKLSIETDGKRIRLSLRTVEERTPVVDGWRRISDFAFAQHTGDSELADAAAVASAWLQLHGYLPLLSLTTGGCDGVMQGREQMQYSLLSREAITELAFLQLEMTSYAVGTLGFATCDKELPGLLGALVRCGRRPSVLFCGGANVPPSLGYHTGTVQGIVPLFKMEKVTLGEVKRAICQACGGDGGGCAFGGTAFGDQNIAAALGMCLARTAAMPSATGYFYEMAAKSAEALLKMIKDRVTTAQIMTPEAVADAIYMIMAIGASQNLFMHLPAIAENAGVTQEQVSEVMKARSKRGSWVELMDHAAGVVGPFARIIPNHGHYNSTDYWFAGGAPEVMFNLMKMGHLHPNRPTVAGTLGDVLEEWAKSEERRYFRKRLDKELGFDPDRIIVPAAKAKKMVRAGELAARSYVFPTGNLGRGIYKLASLKPELLVNGRLERTLPVRVFASQGKLFEAAKAGEITGEQIIVLINQGLRAAGLPETAVLSNFVKLRPELAGLVVLTSARVSGFEGGTVTFSQIEPEELDGGPLGKLVDGDVVRISIDGKTGKTGFDMIGDVKTPQEKQSPEMGSKILSGRKTRSDVGPWRTFHPKAQFAAFLVTASGGPLEGGVEPEKIMKADSGNGG